MIHYLSITPRDPLIARDGRPFGVGQGQRMRSLDWLYPSVVAGSLRTLMGKQAGGHFDETMVQDLKALSIAGPLPMAKALFFPRPQDCLVNENRQCFTTRPMELREGEGSDLPGGLQPILLPDDVEDFKPAKRQPAFWSQARMVKWLIDENPGNIPEKGTIPDGLLNAPKQDVRFHIKMDPKTGAGQQEDAFFMTAGLDLNRKGHATPIQLAMRVEAGDRFSESLSNLNTLHPLGGERRMAQWDHVPAGKSLWDCPDNIAKALKAAKQVRMVLATPAIFSGGWKPGWLNSSEQGLEGTPPGMGVKLHLKGAVIERWQPLSGWSLEKGQVGPKPIRRLVPAGGVYFFDVTHGNAQDLGPGWLQSMCDDKQVQKDGFGLALWGIWDDHHSARKGA